MHTCVFLILNLPNTAEIFRRTEGSFDKTCPSFQLAFISLAGQVACISVCPFFCRPICLPIDYSVCLFVCQSVGLPVAWTSLDFFLSAFMSIKFLLSACQSVSYYFFLLSIDTAVCLSVSPSVCFMPVFLSLSLSVCPSARRSVGLLAILPVCLSARQTVFIYLLYQSVSRHFFLFVGFVCLYVCLSACLFMSVCRS